MTQSFGVLKVLFVIIHVQLAKLTISLLQIKQKKNLMKVVKVPRPNPWAQDYIISSIRKMDTE